MAYMRYKELTKYFYFYKELEIESLPAYVKDYVDKGEEILNAYATSRDKGLFTNKKILLFDVRGLGSSKQTQIIPYNTISTIGILYGNTTAQLLIYTNSGYPLTLKFRNLNPADKTRLRKLYSAISEIVTNRK